MSYTQEIENAASEWLCKHRATQDPQTLALIVERAKELVAKFNVSYCPSLFERSYRELAAEGAITPFRGKMETLLASQSQEDVLTPEEYHRMPSRELQVRLRDPKFKLQVMQLIKAGKI